MKALFASLISLFVFVSGTAFAESNESLTADEIINLVHDHTQRQNIMFGQDSTVANVDHLFALYNPDFIYNHPGQGDIYSRELLYKNSVRFTENGNFDGSFAKKVIGIITGKDAATVEWVWVTDGEIGTEKYMTLIEFEGRKISMMREYW